MRVGEVWTVPIVGSLEGSLAICYGVLVFPKAKACIAMERASAVSRHLCCRVGVFRPADHSHSAEAATGSSIGEQHAAS